MGILELLHLKDDDIVVEGTSPKPTSASTDTSPAESPRTLTALLEAPLHEYTSFIQTGANMLLSKDRNECELTTWEGMKIVDDVALWKGEVLNSDWVALKAKVVVQASSETIMNLLNDVTRMPDFDTMVKDCTVIESLTDSGSASIRLVRAKAVFPTAAREFLVVSERRKLVDGTDILVSRSIERNDIDVTYGHVRAIIHISGYIVRALPNNDGTEVTVVCHTDLGGFIPALLINSVGTTAPVKLLNTIKVIAEAE